MFGFSGSMYDHVITYTDASFALAYDLVYLLLVDVLAC